MSSQSFLTVSYSRSTMSPKSPKSSKSPQKQHKRINTSISLPTAVSPSLAHMAPNSLYIEWQYLNSTLIHHQHEAEQLVRKLASLQAQRDAGEYQKRRPLLRKMALLQSKIRNSTIQQNSLMVRVNQLALELRHRQFVAEEFQQRAFSSHASCFPHIIYVPTLVMVASEPMYYQILMPSIESTMGPNLPSGHNNVQLVSVENFSVVEETSKHDGYQTHENTPSLESNMCWDKMVEQESPMMGATAVTSVDGMFSTSCPPSPYIMPEDGANNLSLTTLDFALDNHKRRQSMVLLSPFESVTV